MDHSARFHNCLGRLKTWPRPAVGLYFGETLGTGEFGTNGLKPRRYARPEPGVDRRAKLGSPGQLHSCRRCFQSRICGRATGQLWPWMGSRLKSGAMKSWDCWDRMEPAKLP